MADKQGRWVTINGRHVFIPKGKKLADVLDYGRDDNFEEDDSLYEDDLEDNHGKARSLLDEIDDVTSENERKSLEEKIRTALANEEITDEEETVLLNKLFDKDYESDLEDINDPRDNLKTGDIAYYNGKKVIISTAGLKDNELGGIQLKARDEDGHVYELSSRQLDKIENKNVFKPKEKNKNPGIPQESVDMPQYRNENGHIVIEDGPRKGLRYINEEDYYNSVRSEDLKTRLDNLKLLQGTQKRISKRQFEEILNKMSDEDKQKLRKQGFLINYYGYDIDEVDGKDEYIIYRR